MMSSPERTERIASNNPRIIVRITGINQNNPNQVQLTEVLSEQSKHQKQVQFFSNHPVGSQISGNVSKILDYGVIVDLGEGVDGFIHITDLSYPYRPSP